MRQTRIYAYAYVRIFIRAYAHLYTRICVSLYAHTRVFMRVSCAYFGNVFLSGTVVLRSFTCTCVKLKPYLWLIWSQTLIQNVIPSLIMQNKLTHDCRNSGPFASFSLQVYSGHGFDSYWKNSKIFLIKSYFLHRRLRH